MPPVKNEVGTRPRKIFAVIHFLHFICGYFLLLYNIIMILLRSVKKDHICTGMEVGVLIIKTKTSVSYTDYISM